jgi:hypothetical protein
MFTQTGKTNRQERQERQEIQFQVMMWWTLPTVSAMFLPIESPRLCRFERGSPTLFPKRISEPFPRRCCFLTGVFHTLRPIDDSLPVTHLDDRCRGNKSDIIHLVAIRTEDDQISQIVIASASINVGNFQHLWDAEATMSTNRRVLSEGKLSIIDPLGHCARPIFA